MMQVPDQDFKYAILVGEKLPNFTFLPKSFEIIQRMILKASFVENLEELDLEKSNC